jgi:hypothetical protein
MAVITLPTWDVDGWTANTIDDDGVVWFTGSPDGLDVDSGWFDPPGVRLAHTDRVGGHGVHRGPNLRTPRVIVLSGSARAPTIQLAQAAIDQFNTLCSDGRLYPLTVVEPTRTLTAAVELGAQPRIRRTRPRHWEWQLTLVAADPRKHGLWPTPSETGLPVDPAGGLNATAPGLDATAPGLNAGSAGSAGFVSVTNTGSAPASPIIRWLGPLTNPQLSDVVTGEQLRYDGVIGDTEDIVINTDEHTVVAGPLGDQAGLSVVLNGTADRSGSLAIVGDWPVIYPGHTTTWAFSAANISTAARAEVYLRPAVW